MQDGIGNFLDSPITACSYHALTTVMDGFVYQALYITAFPCGPDFDLATLTGFKIADLTGSRPAFLPLIMTRISMGHLYSFILNNNREDGINTGDHTLALKLEEYRRQLQLDSNHLLHL